MRFRSVTSIDELWDGDMAGFVVDGRKVLLVRLGNDVFAYEDRCAHLGVAMSEGQLKREVLTCRAHHFQYDARTGRGINPENVALKKLAVKVEDGRVLVGVDAHAERTNESTGD